MLTTRCLALAFLAAACGSNGGSGGVQRCSSLPYSCTEYQNLSASSTPSLQFVETACTQGGGTWQSGACPDGSTRLGGCRIMDDQTTWYYAGGSFSTSADVMSACSAIGGTFVP